MRYLQAAAIWIFWLFHGRFPWQASRRGPGSSAYFAKMRLQHVVKERRDGGRWEWLGEARKRYTIGIGGPTIETYRDRLRWVSLQ